MWPRFFQWRYPLPFGMAIRYWPRLFSRFIKFARFGHCEAFLWLEILYVHTLGTTLTLAEIGDLSGSMSHLDEGEPHFSPSCHITSVMLSAGSARVETVPCSIPVHSRSRLCSQQVFSRSTGRTKELLMSWTSSGDCGVLAVASNDGVV